MASLLTRIGRLLIRLVSYLAVGAIAGALLAVISGAFLGIPAQEGVGRIALINGTATRLAFLLWVVAEVVSAFQKKRSPPSG